MSDELQNATDDIVEECSPFFKQLLGKYDFRLVAAVCLNQASYIMQSGLSAKQITPEQVQEYFSSAFAASLIPRDKPAIVMCKDDKDTGRLK